MRMTTDGDVRALARPLRDEADLDPLLDRIGNASIVAIGEASHGTHEYYSWRAALTRRLIEECGFRFVAVEGDWPDCYRVNRSVRLRAGAHEDPRDALDAFARWPTWMWANDDVVDFCRWLRAFNAARPEEERAGFYGIDVYSLWDSMYGLVEWLREHEPEHVETAAQALRCFEPFGEDGAEYAFASRFAPTSCEQAAVDLLRSLCEQRGREVLPTRGTSGTCTWSTPSTACSATPARRRSCGSTTPTSGTPGRPTWPVPA
jgi:erythromycin esterase-like protein